MPPTLDSLPDDPAVLKAMILAQHDEVTRMSASVRAYEALVEALKARIARLKKQKFGRSSEKIEREIEQLELALEDLEVAMASAASQAAAAITLPPGDAAAEPESPRRGSAWTSIPARRAPSAAVPCASWAGTWRRFWNTSPPTSR